MAIQLRNEELCWKQNIKKILVVVVPDKPFFSISPQMLMMLEYCLSVTDKMLTEPLGGTHDFTRLIWTLELSKDPQKRM